MDFYIVFGDYPDIFVEKQNILVYYTDFVIDHSGRSSQHKNRVLVLLQKKSYDPL